MRYGYFDDSRREYVITRPDTPLPWINYLGNEAYFGLISNTAGGYSFYRDARLRRLTRYRYNNVPLDTGGRYLYLRDDASGAYLVALLAAHAVRRWKTILAGTAWATRIIGSTAYGVARGDPLFRPSRPRPGDLAAARDQPRASRRRICLFSPPSSSACGTPGTT